MRRCGSILVELTIALSLGLILLLQLTLFLTDSVKRLHCTATAQRHALHEGAVLDLLMRDLQSSLIVTCAEDSIVSVHGVCLGKHNACMSYDITWYRVKGRLQRVIYGKQIPQVFGDVLSGLIVDGEKRTVRFIDTCYVVQTLYF